MAEDSIPDTQSAGLSAIILAAGRSERMGSPKLLLRLNGKSLLRHAVDAALASPVNEVVVVLGHRATELEVELPRDKRLRSVLNPGYAVGPHSSLQSGLQALHPDSQAAVVMLGDQPLTRHEAIDALIDEFVAHRSPLVLPVYRGERGHPVLFARSLFAELRAATEEEGRRSVVRRHMGQASFVHLDLDRPPDINTPQDYLQMVRGG